jgi:hypothetical protein
MIKPKTPPRWQRRWPESQDDPTQVMLLAGEREMELHPPGIAPLTMLRNVYCAMLAAAPARTDPQTPPGGNHE